MEQPTTEKHWIVFCFNFLTDYSQSGTSWSQSKGLMEQSLGAHHSCCREMRASYKRWHDSMLKLILEKRISFSLLDRAWIMQTENKGRDVKYESCSVLSDSLRPYGLTVHEILQGKKLEWVAFPFSSRSSQPRDRAQLFHITSGFFTSWTTREAHINDQNLPLSALLSVW